MTTFRYGVTLVESADVVYDPRVLRLPGPSGHLHLKGRARRGNCGKRSAFPIYITSGLVGQHVDVVVTAADRSELVARARRPVETPWAGY